MNKELLDHAQNIYDESPDYFDEHDLTVEHIAGLITVFLEYFQSVKKGKK